MYWRVCRTSSAFADFLIHMVSVPLKCDIVFAPVNEIIENLPTAKTNEWEGLWMMSDQRTGPIHRLICPHPSTQKKVNFKNGYFLLFCVFCIVLCVLYWFVCFVLICVLCIVLCVLYWFVCFVLICVFCIVLCVMYCFVCFVLICVFCIVLCVLYCFVCFVLFCVFCIVLYWFVCSHSLWTTAGVFETYKECAINKVSMFLRTNEKSSQLQM
jgi:hypothetical protein